MEQSLQRPDVSPSSSKDELALSFAQERLWFLDQLEPGNPVFNLASAYRISGQLDVSTFERSINEIGRRHETLRMVFPLAGGNPNLVIRESLLRALKVVDLSAPRHSSQEAAIQRLLTDETQKPFDLSHGPLVRACLFHLSANDHVFLVVAHKIISDDASFGIFFQELLLIYEAFADGKCSPLPELPKRYTEYSVWQRGNVERGSLERQLGYWKRQLAGCPPSLHLATDSSRPSKKTYRGATYRTSLSYSLSTALSDFSQRRQVSLYVLYLAAFGVLLHRYTEQDDFVIGGTLEGRKQAESKPLIGRFEQNIALRIDLSGDPDFIQLLSRIVQMTSEGFDNQDLPFEELLKALQVDRDLSLEPLFQVRFNLRDNNKIAVNPPGLSVETLEFNTGTSQYDLALEVTEQPLGFRHHFQYNRDLFEVATIARIAGHFETLLGNIAANKEGKISLLPLLTDEERQQLLHEWNEIKIEKQEETAFLHELFEAQAARTPESVAVISQKESLTYRELDLRSNQLAHYLQALGVRPEVSVGICLERSVGLVVAILAILKAGGACLPLDPGLPNERLGLLLGSSRSPLILTEGRFLTKLSALGVPVVCLDTIQEVLSRQKKESPVSGLTEQNLAHVFYTSGSVGEPKAVMWHQSKQSKHQSWAQTTFRLTGDDRYLMKSPIGFTPLSSEIFRPLLAGARIIIAPPGVDQDSAALVKLMAEQKITILSLVPSMLRVILEEPNLEKCDPLRQVICFGEVLPVELEKRFFERLSAELSIVYGTTEAPGATYRKCRRGQHYPMVNIGRRHPARQVYVLSSRLQLAPIGVPGEIYSGGDDLVRGYLNRPHLTSERFLPNPFSNTPGARMYRTGDRARYLIDGSLEFLGRTDHQVKIRGFRIEPGEIETTLEGNPVVQQAVVVVRENGRGEKCLVAYVVPKQETDSMENDLRRFAKQWLPDYMVPSAFVLLEKLPLTSNAKVNRKALPEPDWNRRELEVSYIPPRSPVEELLVAIWADVLKRERVGIRDNFFELGGDSLLATQLMSRVRKTFQVELSLRVLFEDPFVEALAIAIVDSLAARAIAPS